MANEIKDFGEKIYGAKKDLWAKNGLTLEMLENFTEADKKLYINKNNIWPSLNYKELLNEGYDRYALYFIKKIKDSLPKDVVLIPIYNGGYKISKGDFIETHLSDLEESRINYINIINKIKDFALKLKTKEDVINIKDDDIAEIIGEIPYYVLIDYKKFRKISNNLYFRNSGFINECKDKNFLLTERKVLEEELTINDLYEIKVKVINAIIPLTAVNQLGIKDTDYILVNGTNRRIDSDCISVFNSREEAVKAKEDIIDEFLKFKEEQKEKTTKRKTRLVAPELSNLERKGPNFTNKRRIEDIDFENVLNIKGGQFGNWENDDSRQKNMNLCYNAFVDLAYLLNIPKADIGLKDNLRIAWGARGSGSALAHYEPIAHVINLTKLRGAGCLAHEWFHALDNNYNIFLNKLTKNNTYSTESRATTAIKELVNALKYKEVLMDNDDARKLEIKKAINNKLNEYFSNHINENGVNDRYFKYKDYMEEMSKYLLDDVKQNKNLVTITESLSKDEKIKLIENEKIDFKILNTLSNDSLIKGLSKIENIEKNYDIDLANYETSQNKINSKISEIKSNISYNCPMNSKDLENLDSLINEIRIICGKTKFDSKVKVSTKYLDDAHKLDASYSKSGNGYWASTVELAARAFETYISMLAEEKGIENPYLFGNANNIAISTGDGVIYGYPTLPEEKEAIKNAFDNLIVELKEMEMFHEASKEEFKAIEEKETFFEPIDTFKEDKFNKNTKYIIQTLDF